MFAQFACFNTILIGKLASMMMYIENSYILYVFVIRYVRLGNKIGQFGTKLDKSETFQKQISVHLGSPNQNVLLD